MNMKMYGSNDKAFGEGEESQEQPMYLQREKRGWGWGDDRDNNLSLLEGVLNLCESSSCLTEDTSTQQLQQCSR